jgi:hypothetical protein
METFLVRVWVPSEPLEPESAATLHGLAQHVRSGFTTAIADGDQLCAWLGEMATEQGGSVRLTASPATDGHEEGNP